MESVKKLLFRVAATEEQSTPSVEEVKEAIVSDAPNVNYPRSKTLDEKELRKTDVYKYRSHKDSVFYLIYPEGNLSHKEVEKAFKKLCAERGLALTHETAISVRDLDSLERTFGREPRK